MELVGLNREEQALSVGVSRADSRLRRHSSGHMPIRLKPSSGRGANTIAIWLALIGVLLPSPQMQFYVAGAKFTPGRLCIILLVIPALVALLRSGRHFLASDIFACATGAWMIIAVLGISSPDLLSSATAECIEFLGGYVVARGLIFGPAPLGAFIRALKILTVVLVMLAMVDRISGRYFTLQSVAAIFHSSAPPPIFREDVIRAMSTLDHPILFGSFCALASAIFLYSERTVFLRSFYCGLCLVGCYLSQSSASHPRLFDNHVAVFL